MDKRDVFLLLGLLGVISGVCIEFGIGWACMMFGIITGAFGVFGGDK